MLRIAALNDSASSDDEPSKIQLSKTKEAKEAEAFSAYNKALLYQQKGHLEHANKLLRNLLTDPFLQEASELVEDEKHSSNHQGLPLLYSIHKNLASIMLERKELREAMKYYIEAVRIDPSEVTVWFRMGQTACKLDKYQLAKQCFQQLSGALQCNSCHWPSLDKAITITFALGDYLMCLEHVSKALEMDHCYSKGVVFRNRIFKEQPSLEKLTKELFEDCAPNFNTTCPSDEEIKEYMDEALKIRSRCRQLVNDFKDEQSKPVTFLEPIIPFTWKNVGLQLTKLYDFAVSSTPPKSLALEIDLRDYYFLDPSVFLGESIPAAVEEPKKKTTPKKVDFREKRKSVEFQKPSDVSEMNAFDKASNQRAQAKCTPDTLTIGDEAKENALMKRLHGKTLSHDQMKSQSSTKENVIEKEGASEIKRLKLSKIEREVEGAMEDLASGDDFDIPLLTSVDMDLDINLSDLKRMELKPELLLRAGEEEFMLSDQKSLESVLSSVIDMECESRANLDKGFDPSINLVEENLKQKENADIEKMDEEYNTSNADIKAPEELTTGSKHLVPSLESALKTLTEPQPENNSESEKKAKPPSDPSKQLISGHKERESLDVEKVTQSVRQSMQDVQPQNVLDSVTRDSKLWMKTHEKSESIVCLEQESTCKEEDVDGQSTASSMPSAVKDNQMSLHHLAPSPITSSLLSPTQGLPSSATFYHNMLNESMRKKPSSNEKSQNSENSIQEQTFDEMDVDIDLIPVQEASNKDEGAIQHINEKSLPETSTKSSSTYHGISQKSTGEFIEDVVRDQLGLNANRNPASSSPHTSAILGDFPSPSGQQKSTIRSAESLLVLKNKMSPVSSPLNKKSPTPVSLDTRPGPSAAASGSSPAMTQFSRKMSTSPQSHSQPSPNLQASATTGSEHSVHKSKLDQLPHKFPGIFSPSDIGGQGYFQSTDHATVHALISPPVSHTSSNPFLQRDRRHTTGSALFSSSAFASPPAKYHNALPVLPPYPLLSHQQDYSFAPYSASLMASIYPPLSPNSKYPLIPSTSPSYLRSRLLGRNLLDPNLHLQSSSSTSQFSPPAMSHVLTPSLSQRDFVKQHAPGLGRPSYELDFQTKNDPSSVSCLGLSSRGFPYSERSLQQKRGMSFQAMLKSMLESPFTISDKPGVLSSPHKSSAGKDGSPAVSQRRSYSTSGSKRGPKRKINDVNENDWTSSCNRRSMRNRSGRSKKEEPSVDYKLLIKKHFPESLRHNLQSGNVESFCDSQEKNADKEEPWNVEIKTSDLSALADTEENDVKNLIRECFKRHGIIDIMYKFLLHLTKKAHCLWYEGIADMYIEIYSRLRNHLSVPNIFEGLDELNLDVFTRHAKIIVMHCELVLDKVCAKKVSTSISTPIATSKEGEERRKISKLLGEFNVKDMDFLYLFARCGRDSDSEMRELMLRFYWMKAKQHQILGEILNAIDCFEVILELINKNEAAKAPIILPNMTEDKVISAAMAAHELDSLHRFERLENTRKLYDQGNYTMVVDTLVAVFKKQTKPNSGSQKERPSQLLLLQESLYKLSQKEECAKWAEFAIDDCLRHYKGGANSQLKQAWSSALVSTLCTLDGLWTEEPELISTLNHENLVKLAHNLVAVIQINLDVTDSESEMPIDSLMPWKILFRILKYEEQKNNDTSVADKREKEENEEFQNTPSLQMLIDAHEHLGRHGWCTKDDGSLLLFLMSKLLAQMDLLDEDDREELVVPLEQCILCLYNHPNKKGKSRHLSDHNAKQVSLTWERSGPIFAYFAFGILPEFDSKKTSSISSDLEHLLRRICHLVPEDMNPASHMEVISTFIDGTSLVTPPDTLFLNSPHTSWPDSHKIENLLYYLLADFYFKNNEFKKAVKFYQLDLVINATRVDSWTGLALAKMSQIEQELNAIDMRMDSPAPKKWDASLRCFQRAVELETKNRKLWMEYGILTYQLHSHASRQTKLWRLLAIPEEIFRTAQVRQESMLWSACHSFDQAKICEGDGSGDDWLVHYMLGKIAEKRGSRPSVFLEHYINAAKCLHEEKAVYPKKILFTSTPPHLALESLEVYYRIHASVLKLLLADALPVEDLSSVDLFLNLAGKGNFASCEGKHKEMTEEDRDDVFSPVPVKSNKPNTTSQSKVKRVYHRNPMDHEYSYFKSTSDSQSSDNPEIENVPWPVTGRREDATLAAADAHLPCNRHEKDKLPARSSSIAQVENSSSSGIGSPKDGVDQPIASTQNQDQLKFDVEKIDPYQNPISKKIISESAYSIESHEICIEMNVDMKERKENTERSDAHPSESDNSLFQHLNATSNIVETNSSEMSNPLDKPGQSTSQMAADEGEERLESQAENQSVVLQSSSVGCNTSRKVLQKQDSEGFTPRHLSQDGPHSNEDELVEQGVSEDKESHDAELKSLSLSEHHQSSINDFETEAKNVFPGGKSTTATESERGREEELQSRESKKCESVFTTAESVSKISKLKDPDADKSQCGEGDEDKLEETHQEKKMIENAMTVDSATQHSKSEHDCADLNNDDTKDPLTSKERKEEQKSKDVDKTSCPSSSESSLETTGGKTDKKSNPVDNLTSREGTHEPVDPSDLKSEITQKCLLGLHLCASRFSSHYKSIYRLAHFYYSSKTHKNLTFAYDLLLGKSNWQQQSHMPAPGLFYERKLNNFFQGLWKIPNDDIDRAGSFPSHVFQSVILLLQVLCELEDFEMLKYLRDQLKRTPDSTKKYLRDAERQSLVEEAYKKMLELMKKKMENSESWSEEKCKDHLASIYRLWLWGKGSKQDKEATPLLLQAFRIMMKGRTDINRLTAEQAILYCKQNVSKGLIQNQGSSPVAKERSKAGQHSTCESSKPASKESKQKDPEPDVWEIDVEHSTDSSSHAQNVRDSSSPSLTQGASHTTPSATGSKSNTNTNSNSNIQSDNFSQAGNDTDKNESIIIISDVE